MLYGPLSTGTAKEQAFYLIESGKVDALLMLTACINLMPDIMVEAMLYGNQFVNDDE